MDDTTNPPAGGADSGATTTPPPAPKAKAADAERYRQERDEARGQVQQLTSELAAAETDRDR